MRNDGVMPAPAARLANEIAREARGRSSVLLLTSKYAPVESPHVSGERIGRGGIRIRRA